MGKINITTYTSETENCTKFPNTYGLYPYLYPYLIGDQCCFTTAYRHLTTKSQNLKIQLNS